MLGRFEVTHFRNIFVSKSLQDFGGRRPALSRASDDFVYLSSACVFRAALLLKLNNSVAHMSAELWLEMCFPPYGALVERAARFRRADRDAPNESSVAQMRAEL